MELDDFGDDSATRFWRTLQASNLIPANELNTFAHDFCASYADGSRPNADALVGYLLARGALTPWQAENLLKGRFKRFFVDDYKLLDCLDSHPSRLTYTAVNVANGRRVRLRVRVAFDEPGGPVYYRVIPDVSQSSRDPDAEH